MYSGRPKQANAWVKLWSCKMELILRIQLGAWSWPSGVNPAATEEEKCVSVQCKSYCKRHCEGNAGSASMVTQASATWTHAVSTTITRTVKPTHLQSEPGSPTAISVSVSLSAFLPVQDEQPGLGPSTSLQQLTSASVKCSETTSAQDNFYKPCAVRPALHHTAPFLPKATFPIPEPSPRTHRHSRVEVLLSEICSFFTDSCSRDRNHFNGKELTISNIYNFASLES